MRPRESLPCPAAPTQPYSFRLPANGQVDPWFGGTRTFWANLIRGEAAAVQSFAIKQTGAKRGIRFILFDSARAYMERQHKPQAA